MTAIPLHFYFYIKPFVGNEPFHLTMYAGKENALDTLEHPIKYDQALSGLENNIRSNYQINTTRVKRNVILIVVDALRPDHMGVYNYKRNTTPFLTSLDAQGIVQKFSNVRASCGASACGLSTLATARFAHQIPDNPYTLSQVLAKNGYSTQIILSGDHTNFYNLRSLYGKVDTYYDGSMAAPFYMNDDALIIHKLNTLPDFNGKPTLFQFHLMSTHGLSKHMPEFEVYKPNKGYSGNIRGIPSVEHVNYYDNGVIQSDYYINQIMKVLDRKKYLQDALIIVTADHGESLGEHNMYSHANSVYEVLLRVPFLLINAKNTSALTKQASSFSSQADIAPTVLHELGLQIPENWVGKAIQLQSKEDRQSTYTYFQLHPRVGMYIHGDSLWKYWLNTYNSEEFVFNLDEDPNEQRNLITKIDPKLRLKWRELSQKTRTE
jgi:glucan phosphoethanolaminetransferase (alkaline phosphatase superfamily)